ncbi:MAG: hypothetical protein ACYTA5_16705 [Planctomycetota bacterium]
MLFFARARPAGPSLTICDASCQNIEPAVCGNGIVEEGEECEPPGTTLCDASCQSIEPAVCGNGIVEEGEECEPPGTTTCDASCHTIPIPPLKRVEYFANEREWLQKVEEQGGERVAFDTTAANILKAVEVDVPPTTNKALGPTLTFLGSVTGYAFDFWLKNKIAQTPLGLVYDDNEFGGFDVGYNYISIGDVGQHENDDFEIGVAAGAGSEVFAIGIFVDHNDNPHVESLRVENDQHIELVTFRHNVAGVQLPKSGGTDTGVFMGVVSPEPLSMIRYYEDDGGDDIRVKNFRFGVR